MGGIKCGAADMHNDILTGGLNDAEIKAYLDGALKYCDVITMAVWTSKSAPPLSYLKKTFEKYREYGPDGSGAGRGKVVFAVEDMGFLSDSGGVKSGSRSSGGNSAEEAFEERVDGFFSLPAVYAGLVWNGGNAFGGGAFSEDGLTEAGKRVIGRFNNPGIALDFAHMNKKTFYAAAELYRKPILCSHTCFEGCVSKNAPLYSIARARNIDDGQTDVIVKSGGLIGLTFVATFLTGAPECTSGDLVRHIDYFVSKYGYKNLGIGTDFFGTEELPADIKDYRGLGILAEKLAKLGYNNEAVNCILSQNYKRFCG